MAGLLDVVENVKPSCIIGVSDQGGSFNKQVRAARHAFLPHLSFILPLAKSSIRISDQSIQCIFENPEDASIMPGDGSNSCLVRLGMTISESSFAGSRGHVKDQ